MPPEGGAAPALARSVARRRDELGMEPEHFLDIRRMGVERLDDGFARKDERLVKGIQMMHDTLAQAAFRIAQANDRSRPDLGSRNAAGIGNGMSLSHERSGFSAHFSR